MTTSPVAPPVVQLGLVAGWSPLPLSVRDARRAASSLRSRPTPPPAVGRSRAPDPVCRVRGLQVRYG